MIQTRIFFIVICFVCHSVSATELVFHFNNPQFGGNPLNSGYFMGQASEQNNFKAPTVPVQPKTQIETFKDNLQRAILNRLSSSATQNLFDDDGNLKLGTDLSFDLDNDGQSDFSVKVDSTADMGNVGILITDGISSTTLVVPVTSSTTALTPVTSILTPTVVPAGTTGTISTPATNINAIVPISNP